MDINDIKHENFGRIFKNYFLQIFYENESLLLTFQNVGSNMVVKQVTRC